MVFRWGKRRGSARLVRGMPNTCQRMSANVFTQKQPLHHTISTSNRAVLDSPCMFLYVHTCCMLCDIYADSKTKKSSANGGTEWLSNCPVLRSAVRQCDQIGGSCMNWISFVYRGEVQCVSTPPTNSPVYNSVKFSIPPLNQALNRTSSFRLQASRSKQDRRRQRDAPRAHGLPVIMCA